MSDLLAQQLSTVQTDKQPLPATIASAATIAPQTKFTRVTGTTEITNITPFTSGYQEITLVFSSAYANALNTGGGVNGIAVAYTSVVDRPIDLCFDPRTLLWYPKAVA
jgi:hypothetical protein